MPFHFFVPQLIDTSQVELEGDRAHYLGRVMRVRTGDELACFDGQGGRYLANAIVLPYVVAFNQEAAATAYALVERRLGLPDGGLHAWLLALRAETGIPHTLTEAGVARDLIDALADQAIADGCHASNPRPCSRADLHALYAAAFDG